jgi:hypothetical protein
MLLTAAGAASALSEADFTDIPDDWSHDAIAAAIDNGLLQGDGGKINPQGTMTRAQMAAMYVRAFGATKTSADIGEFTDVDKNAWYYNEMSIAVGIGLFKGDGGGKLDPNGAITREQMAVVTARAFGLTDTDADLSVYADSGEIAPWARDSVAALVKAGYLRGYEDGKLGLKNIVTRAESAQIVYNIVDVFITEPGEYTFKADGIVIVRVPGVVLKDCEISGSIILGDDLSREDIVLENVTFTGAGEGLIVRSGEQEIDENITPLDEFPGTDENGEDSSRNDSIDIGSFIPTTTTYTVNLTMNSSVTVNSTSTPTTGLKGGDLFWLELADHIKSNAGNFKTQLGGGISSGLFGKLFDGLRDDVTVQDLFKLDAAYSPSAAKAYDVEISALAGSSPVTLAFTGAGDAGGISFTINASVTKPGTADAYTLSVEITAGINNLTVSSGGNTTGLKLYDQIFGALQTKLGAAIGKYNLSNVIDAGDYIGEIKTWFYGLDETSRAGIITTGDAALLKNKDITVGEASGQTFALSYGSGALSINASVVR